MRKIFLIFVVIATILCSGCLMVGDTSCLPDSTMYSRCHTERGRITDIFAEPSGNGIYLSLTTPSNTNNYVYTSITGNYLMYKNFKESMATCDFKLGQWTGHDRFENIVNVTNCR